MGKRSPGVHEAEEPAPSPELERAKVAEPRAPAGPEDAVAGKAGAEDLMLTPYDLSKRWAWAVRPRTLQNWRSTRKGPPFTKVSSSAVLYRLADIVKYERDRDGQFLKP